jgi:SAM-dependent methyltransferase
LPICPDCRGSTVAFDDEACALCGWHLATEDGTPVFMSQADRESAILSAYTELYERIARDDLEQSIQAREALEIEASRLLESIGDVGGKDVCEVGVGQGALLAKLATLGPRSVVGVELARPYLERLSSGGTTRVVRANAEHLPFREEFDVVIASDVLEHVLNPADFLATAAEALRPGGRLVIKVPFREDLAQYSTLNGYPYRFVHLRTFDRALLVESLENFGLEVLEVGYSGFYIGRWRKLVTLWRPLNKLVQWSLERRFGPDPGVNRIDPRVGRVLMRPAEITAIAERPAAAAGP